VVKFKIFKNVRMRALNKHYEKPQIARKEL
jgi:hypothetical protein